MAVTADKIIPAKDAEAVQTTQYTSSTGRTVIDKFTANCHLPAGATLSVHIVNAAGVADATNLVATKALADGEAYTFPEVVGHVLGAGDFISTLASVGAAVSIRASGRVIT